MNAKTAAVHRPFTGEQQMRRMMLLALVFISLAMFARVYAQNAETPDQDSPLAARNRALEKTVQSQKLRIARLEKQLRTRDEEVHMLVKIVSKQSDKDSSDEGSTSSDSSCDSSPVVRARATHRAHVTVVRKPQHRTSSAE
jgi:TolA-binding protein